MLFPTESLCLHIISHFPQPTQTSNSEQTSQNQQRQLISFFQKNKYLSGIIYKYRLRWVPLATINMFATPRWWMNMIPRIKLPVSHTNQAGALQARKLTRAISGGIHDANEHGARPGFESERKCYKLRGNIFYLCFIYGSFIGSVGKPGRNRNEWLSMNDVVLNV